MASSFAKKSLGILLTAACLASFGCGSSSQDKGASVTPSGDGAHQITTPSGGTTGGGTTGGEETPPEDEGLSAALIMSILN